MASPTRKPKGRLRKEQETEPCCSHRRRQTIARRRQPILAPINVREIYRLLSADKHNQERKKQSRISPREEKYHPRHRREPSYDSSSYDDSCPSIQESEYSKSVATSMDDLPSFMKVGRSFRTSSSENSSLSVEPITLAKTMDNARALLKKKSLVQVINNYIKAGIEEGKRQAKKYIRKALSFGVKSGYLIPTDPRGQVIRVSPTLIDLRKTDAESRRKRRRARKGEDGLGAETKIEKRKTTPPWNVKKQTRRAEITKPETPPRKRRKVADTKRSASPRKKKVEKKQKPRGKTGDRQPAKTRKRSEPFSTSMNENLSANASEDSLRKTRRQQSTHELPEKRLRITRSPHPRRQEAENSRRSRANSSDGERSSQRFNNVGMNEAALSIGRRKSSTSRDSLRNSNNVVNPGNSMRQLEEKLDPVNENKDGNAIGNVN